MTLPPDKSLNLACRLFSSPPARILLLGLVFIILMALNTDVMVMHTDAPIKALLHVIALVIAGIAVYVAYAKFVEQREVSELAKSGMGRPLGIGLCIGAGLYTLCVLILMALGVYSIVGFNPASFLIPAIPMALSSGVFEELLFRGVLFGSLERWLGSWAALVVSSLLFGLTHLLNPEATLEGALFIALEAGVLLAAAYILTRQLWLSIGFHMGWNYTQSAIFSGTVSGNTPEPGWIQASINGPDWLTGGSFGLESSPLALFVCTTTGILMLVMATKRGNIIPPFWKRKG